MPTPFPATWRTRRWKMRRLAKEEELAVAEAREWSKHNQPIPHEDVLSEFGLTLAEFERCQTS
jgi:hypothetical protein